MFANFKDTRQTGEGFGDWCQRLGLEQLLALLPEELRKPMPKHAPPEPNYRLPEGGNVAEEPVK